MLLTAAAEWALYAGHFHPVIVHLPIGILFVAFILELVAWKRKDVSLNYAIEISLLVGFGSAVIACILGWFLSEEGGYAETTLQLHQWMGIGVAVLAGICWLIKKKNGSLIKATAFYRWLVLFMILLLTVTGHFGGNMTHGDDYLTAGMPQPLAGWFGIAPEKDSVVTKKVITNIQEAAVYVDLVVPVLNEKCFSCHSSKKIKGGFRLDEEKRLFKGGKHGAVIIPGNANESELIKRLHLPMEDDKRMAPKGQHQLSKEEIALLTWWINTGADTKKQVKELGPDSSTLSTLAIFSAAGHKKDTVKQEKLSAVFGKNPSAANASDLKALKDLGILVSPVAIGNNLLEVSCINFPAFGNKEMALLAKLADNIVWLRMDNTQITDDALAQVGQFKNLVRLNLADTKVSTAGITKLKDLANLEYINIVNTNVDDAGLLLLSRLPLLNKIYCWNTKVTPAGINNIRKTKPSLVLESGTVVL